MIEIRFHGRGGQGAVIASKLLAQAVFEEKKFVQAFPSFGVERRGAPVQAFLRVDENRINLRANIYTPNHLIVLDPTLIKNEATFAGLLPEGWVLVNCNRLPGELSIHSVLKENRIATVDASSIAINHRLGSRTSPIVNTAILGAFCRITGICHLESLEKAIKKGVPVKADANIAAARDAYEQVKFAGAVECKQGVKNENTAVQASI